jgi:hypothetical protein
MIETRQIAAYLHLKRGIAAVVAAPGSGFQASRRELSEGLAKQMEIAGESWTYSTQKGGCSFTSPRRRFSVFVADDPARNAYFTSAELLAYLRAFTSLENLNQLVVDTWLTRAAMRGEVAEVPDVRGHWRLGEQAG